MQKTLSKYGFAFILALAWPVSATAGLVLSPLIVDMAPGQPQRSDVEMFNSGLEKLYVVVEPARIDDPGLPTEHRVQSPDPEALGLIATPGRVILDPGQRKFLRLAALQPPGPADRIFRVTVKPVVGAVTGDTTGLKLLVGYDMLVIQRARDPTADVIGTRSSDILSLRNSGNSNVELFRGRQCSPGGDKCIDLPGQRIYAGASLTVPIKAGWKVIYNFKVAGHVGERSF